MRRLLFIDASIYGRDLPRVAGGLPRANGSPATARSPGFFAGLARNAADFLGMPSPAGAPAGGGEGAAKPKRGRRGRKPGKLSEAAAAKRKASNLKWRAESRAENGKKKESEERKRRRLR